ALAKGDARGAVNLLDRAVSLGADPTLLPDLGVALRDAGEFARAEDVFAAAAAAAQDAGDQVTALRVTVGGFHARLLRDPASADDPFIEAGTLRFLAVLEARLGNFDAGRAAAGRAQALFEELGVSGHLRVSITLALADIELLAGNAADAERELRAGIEWLDRIG